MTKMELCYPEDNCLTEDTIIVVLYAVFCICFGFVIAVLVIWADKRKSKTISITNTNPANGNIEVERKMIYKTKLTENGADIIWRSLLVLLGYHTIIIG